MPEALAWVAEQADLDAGDYRPAYLGEDINTYDTLLRQLLLDDDSGNVRTDFAGHIANRQYALLESLQGQLTRLTEVRGVQAYCLECPAPRTMSTTKQRDVSFLQKLALLTGLR